MQKRIEALVLKSLSALAVSCGAIAGNACGDDRVESADTGLSDASSEVDTVPDAAPDAADSTPIDDAAEADADTSNDTDLNPDTSAPEGGDSLASGCATELAWWNPVRDIWATRGFLGIPKGRALVLSADDAHSFHRALDLNDGRALRPALDGQVLSLSPDGSRLLLLKQREGLETELAITPLDTSGPDTIITPPEGFAFVSGALGEDGALLIASCPKNALEGLTFELRLAGGTKVEHKTNAACTSWDGGVVPMAFANDGSVALFAAGGELWAFDLEADSKTRLMTVPADEGTPGEVIAIASRPGHDAFAVSTSEGLIHLISKSGAPLREPLESSVTLANRWTFAPPILISPVAFSPDGAHLAFASSADVATVIAFDSGDKVLDVKAQPRRDSFIPADIPSFPVAFAFTPDGRGLVSDFIDGTSLTRCVDAPTPSLGELGVEIVGPTKLSVNTPGTWTTRLTNAGRLLAFHATFGEFDATTFGETPGATHQPSEPGTFELVITVHDGVSVGTGRLQVEVTP